MEAEAIAGAAPNTARFSRYRSVRKAAALEGNPPALPSFNPDSCTSEQQQSHSSITRAPSRYHRKINAPQQHHVPLPADQYAALPARSHARQNLSKPQPILEAQLESGPPAPDRRPPQGSPRQVRAPHKQAEPVRRTPQPQQTTVHRSNRYRNRTTSAPKERAAEVPKERALSNPSDKPASKRTSYDQAREEARLILEGEYDRLQRLKTQQAEAERDRKKRAEAKVVAQRAEQTLQERKQVEQERERVQQKEQEQEERPQTSRKRTIGGGGSHPASPSASAPLTPPPSRTLQHVQEQRNHNHSRDEPTGHDSEKDIASPLPASTSDAERPTLRQRVRRATHSRPDNRQAESPSAGALTDSEKPTLRQRVRRATHTRPRDASTPPSFEPKVGDGPPKTAVNGPAQTVDAPVSAVNAGDRRVEIRCEKSKIWLPVTPTTTVKDLLNSASVIMSQAIDPRTSVLIETYYPLGLERPLRRYEHIRDVMNSWDSDTQNYMMIMPQSECAAVGLEQKEAPKEQPSSTMVYLHHSQRPGKWEKHYMILKPDGQVTASPKENDGTAPNVFHLSDFDIYMPTKKQARHLRPPKKICFAIKSQQRSIMFESTENFVHFFSTNDKVVADQWYNSVQAWRSWYLVNILDQGTATKPVIAAPPSAALNKSHALRRPSTSHSRDSIPYQLGTFEPLLEFNADAFAYGEQAKQEKPLEHKPSNSPQRSRTLVNHARNRSIAPVESKPTDLECQATTKRQAPSSRRPGTSAGARHHRDDSGPTVPSSTDAAFTGSGLLARAFSVKKAQAEENAAFLDNTDNAFTGKGLLSHKMSTKHFAINEDPTPGVIRDTNEAFVGSGLLSRKLSVKKSMNEDHNPGVVKDTNDAFTGAGLLHVQRSLTKKRSANSPRPGQPLVNLSGNSTFTDASLLRQVEGWEAATGQTGPVIDRSRGLEVSAKTGEV